MRGALSPNMCSTIGISSGMAASYAHMHKLLVSPPYPPSFAVAIIHLNLACFLSSHWGPPHCFDRYHVAQHFGKALDKVRQGACTGAPVVLWS
jgi:hypothetical protein